jgi:hypothetical protein
VWLPPGKFFVISFPIIQISYDVICEPKRVLPELDNGNSNWLLFIIKIQRITMPIKQEYSALYIGTTPLMTLPWYPPTPSTLRRRHSFSRIRSTWWVQWVDYCVVFIVWKYCLRLPNCDVITGSIMDPLLASSRFCCVLSITGRCQTSRRVTTPQT